jgi:hypothetical protein
MVFFMTAVFVAGGFVRFLENSVRFAVFLPNLPVVVTPVNENGTLFCFAKPDAGFSRSGPGSAEGCIPSACPCFACTSSARHQGRAKFFPMASTSDLNSAMQKEAEDENSTCVLLLTNFFANNWLT